MLIQANLWASYFSSMLVGMPLRQFNRESRMYLTTSLATPCDVRVQTSTPAFVMFEFENPTFDICLKPSQDKLRQVFKLRTSMPNLQHGRKVIGWPHGWIKRG